MGYKTITRNKVTYVMRPLSRSLCANPNFLGTGMALVAILRKGETLKDYIKRIPDIKKIAEERSEKAWIEHGR